jgi:hypothetical protein
MKIKLKSDFIDYYDHWFDREGQIFERMSHSGMSRRDMFDFFEKIGLETPPHGTPKQVFNSLSDCGEGNCISLIDVVIYLNGTSHRGEGKILLPLMKAMQEYPTFFCSLYYPTMQIGAASLRYLQIGDKIFWLRYTSNDWRSNYGDVKIEVLSQEKDGFHPRIDLPLFAVDFIFGPNLYAIDFNIAPGVKGTGVEDILSAKEAAAAIKKWFERKGE